MLHTPLTAAEKIKIEYGSLLRNYSPNNELGVTKVKIPRIGDEDSISEVALDYVQTIIHARVEEVLVLVKNKLKKSGLMDNTGSGIVITGGMSYLDGIKRLAERIFEGVPISVSIPKNIKNGFMSFDEANMATIVGLLFYSLGTNRSYQLDSSKKLIKPVKNDRIAEPKISVLNNSSEKLSTEDNKEHIQIKDNSTVLTPLLRDKKTGVSKFWSKVSEWF
jgi:cell division protein FtsA